MSDDDEERRLEFLENHYPFIAQGAEPPGRWIEPQEADQAPIAETQRHWQGRHGWRTRHGDAVIRWDLGHPRVITTALYPDGTRGDVFFVLDHGYRRRANDLKRWVSGTIDIRTDDVIFRDGVSQPSYMPPLRSTVPNLEADLANDDAFLASLEDDRFAKAVYAAFRNHRFFKDGDERSWLCGDRQAAHLVSNLRGLGESYQDYF